MRFAKLIAVVGLGLSAALFCNAQMSSAPVLTSPPKIQYPAIARAAHVSGEVVVRFSIGSDGSVGDVQAVSGPVMLLNPVVEQIKGWRFQTPLPVNAQHDFEARYVFDLQSGDDLPEDDLDGPLYAPCCGDSISLSRLAGQVKGLVQSADASQKIDVTPAVEKPIDRCPEDKEKQAPKGEDAGDYAELIRMACTEECMNYRVRAYRDGRVMWHGKERVVLKGEGGAHVRPEAAAELLKSFEAQAYWATCSARPPAEDAFEEDTFRGNYLIAQVAGHEKTIYVNENGFEAKLAWAVDRVADTHRWRHGDAANEPYDNMREDLQMPKQGVTALMRATFRFNPSNAQQTLEPLKRLLASGVDVDAADESGWTALMYAEGLDTYDRTAVKLLLDAHAGVNQRSIHGDTALMIAAYHGGWSEALVEHGADVNVRNSDGVTALMLLAQSARTDPDELKEAIAAGADVSIQDKDGHTALDYLVAASCGKPFVELPKPGWQGVVIEERPSPCPATSEDFLKSKALLRAHATSFDAKKKD